MKKGFTLIELLAVIVILAIIALIVTPVISNIINNSKKAAAVQSAYGYKDAVDNKYAVNLSTNLNDKLDGSYIVGGGMLDVDATGTEPDAGYLAYSNGKLVNGCLIINGYEVKYNDDKFSSTGKGDCDITYKYFPISQYGSDVVKNEPPFNDSYIKAIPVKITGYGEILHTENLDIDEYVTEMCTTRKYNSDRYWDCEPIYSKALELGADMYWGLYDNIESCEAVIKEASARDIDDAKCIQFTGYIRKFYQYVINNRVYAKEYPTLDECVADRGETGCTLMYGGDNAVYKDSELEKCNTDVWGQHYECMSASGYTVKFRYKEIIPVEQDINPTTEDIEQGCEQLSEEIEGENKSCTYNERAHTGYNVTEVDIYTLYTSKAECEQTGIKCGPIPAIAYNAVSLNVLNFGEPIPDEMRYDGAAPFMYFEIKPGKRNYSNNIAIFHDKFDKLDEINVDYDYSLSEFINTEHDFTCNIYSQELIDSPKYMRYSYSLNNDGSIRIENDYNGYCVIDGDNGYVGCFGEDSYSSHGKYQVTFDESCSTWVDPKPSDRA